MRRREFIALLGSALVMWPVAALAQTVDRVRRIGFLSASAEDDAEAAKRLAAFKLRLQELGWTEGKNLRIDVRFGNNNGERIRQAATELIEAAPDAIVSTTSTTTTLALMNATGNILIVAAVSGDPNPIALGFTESLSYPTGNITGFIEPGKKLSSASRPCRKTWQTPVRRSSINRPRQRPNTMDPQSCSRQTKPAATGLPPGCR
jgi:putative tryptophan/tyrosine transport system substrate-binding protein